MEYHEYVSVMPTDLLTQQHIKDRSDSHKNDDFFGGVPLNPQSSKSVVRAHSVVQDKNHLHVG